MAAGDPTGLDLCSGTTDGNTLVVAPTDYEFRLVALGAGTPVVVGTTYAILVRIATENAIVWGKTVNGVAGNSLYCNDAGAGTWTPLVGYDLTYQTSDGGVLKDNYSPAPTSSLTVYGDQWVAQTFVASSSYTLDAVRLYLRRPFNNTPGTVTVSIRATVGAPTKATTPAPANAASDVTLDQATLTWVDGGGATSYNVYYGDNAANVAAADTTDETGIYLGNQAGLSYTVTGITLGSPYAYLVARYWRIDSVNAAGTTTGDAWSFTTIRLTPPTVTKWYSGGGAAGYYYRLLPQSDGSEGDPPGTGVEDTDYEVLDGYLPNFINTSRRLVSCANNKFWYEDVS